MKNTMSHYSPNSDNNDDEDDEYTFPSSDATDEMNWMDWFLNIKGNEIFVEVDSDYIRDSFNLTGLQSCVKNFERALNIVLDQDDGLEYLEDTEDNEDSNALLCPPAIAEAQVVYGLIHARYILTHKGMEAMLEKYRCCEFGFCPNASCKGRPVLPLGLSDTIGVSEAKVFCSCCNEIYTPTISRLAIAEGAFFGTSFPHMFYMFYPHLLSNSPPKGFVPKLFGFNVWNGVRDVLRIMDEESATKKKSSGSHPPDPIATVLASGNIPQRYQSLGQKETEESSMSVLLNAFKSVSTPHEM